MFEAESDGSVENVVVRFSIPRGKSEITVSDSLSIQKDCGHDSICIPNLSVKTQK